MTIDELIEKLEEAKQTLGQYEGGIGGNAEVMLGHQPSYPLRFTIAGVALLGSNPVCPDCEERYLDRSPDGHWLCPSPTCGTTMEDDDLPVTKADREVLLDR